MFRRVFGGPRRYRREISKMRTCPRFKHTWPNPGLWQSLEGRMIDETWCGFTSRAQLAHFASAHHLSMTRYGPKRSLRRGESRVVCVLASVQTPGSAGATERPATPRHLTQTSRSKIESTGLGSWDSRYSPRLPNWRSRRSSSMVISAEDGHIGSGGPPSYRQG